jgi:Na+/proline symporter
LSIASVLWGAMLGVFLLGTLTRRAGESGTIVGMVAGVAINLLLWLQPHALAVPVGGHTLVFPKIAWTWWVLIGSLVTCAVGYSASLLFPGPIRAEEAVEG